MFHYREANKKSEFKRSDELKEANRIIQESIDNNMHSIIEELKKSDIPAEEHDKIIKDIRREAQLEMIKSFNQKVKEKTKLKI